MKVLQSSLSLVHIALAAALAVAAPAAAQSDDDLARELLDATDDVQRGESSYARVSMHVKTARWERSMTMESWSKGQEKSLIKILSPAKEAGMATLKVEDNIWNYLPKVDRTMKVPASMMSGAWMGSHFSNDDLVKESRMADDYTYSITSRPEDNPDGLFVIELIPKPDAPVVWGKVEVTIRGEDRMPVSIEYFDEKDGLARTMNFSDIRELGGKLVPCKMTLLPKDKPEEFTVVTYDTLEFDLEIPDSTFTLQALKP
jgi:outer membrane lipoprotein-sorting protein